MSEADVEKAIAALTRGGIVVVTDDRERENEADLIMAAEAATTESVAFFWKHTSGFICAALPASRTAELGLPMMTSFNQDPLGTAFTVTVDSLHVGTGISASDRAATLRSLADPGSTAADFRRPGHIPVLRGRDGGVLTRRGHTEASLDLVRLAGCGVASVLCEIVSDNGQDMARGEELRRFARRYQLPMIAIADIVEYVDNREPRIRALGNAPLTTRYGKFTAHVYADLRSHAEHIALSLGSVEPTVPTLVRLHSECLTGDVFGSLRCDCGEQLSIAMQRVASAGSGVIVYLRGHEGRGIGLSDKIRAYHLQDQGMDTVDANLALGLPVDARSYEAGCAILQELGVRRARCMTNNANKVRALSRFMSVTREPIETAPTPQNFHYLKSKSERLGHSFRDLSL